MTRSIHHPPLRRFLVAAMFCGLLLGAGQPAAAHDRNGHHGGGDYEGTDHRPDSSYGDGFSLGYQEGFEDGRRTCDSKARHRDSRRRPNQGRYDRGYAEGYDAGHRAACDDGAHGRPDPSYRQGFRVGYRKGFDDGQTACDSKARRRDDRRRPNQSRYDRGYKDGYDAGHRAACQ